MLVLVIGGSGSGKSEFSENLAKKIGKEIYYIATMFPYGKSAIERIERHKKLRAGKNFNVIEQYRDIDKIKVNDTVILECMSNLLANEMFGENPKDGQYILECVKKIECENLIIVSNNIFEDGIEYDDTTKRYIEELAYINAELTKDADRVVEVVAGIPLEVK